MTANMTRPPIREIIADFRQEIFSRRVKSVSPKTTVINFRDDLRSNRGRCVFEVPLDLLRYRKENGRISSSVLSHERAVGPLEDTDQEAQEKIAEFLRDKDPEKTDELRKLIHADGQKEPAIVTCDGFLIDGNRRRLVISDLCKSHPSDARFQYMKVVILPGHGEEGGPPTLREIEQIENRYQLQKTGKAEYYGFDAALSIRAKIDRGFSLEDQLRDDPQYKNMGESDFSKIVRRKRKELLEPLRCIDRYLESLGRPEHYQSVSTRSGDPEGRWQAFVDYAEFYRNKLRNQRNRANIGVEEYDVPAIEHAAFKVIRLRALPGLGKVHTIMRRLPKYCKHAKKELIELDRNVKHELPDFECFDSEGNRLSFQMIDQKWAGKYRTEIVHRIHKAHEAQSEFGGTITTMKLLRDAVKKLSHQDLDINAIPLDQLPEAQRLTNQIQNQGDVLSNEVYSCQKRLTSITHKK